MKNEYQKIESPLSSFNNILSEITKNLETNIFQKEKLKLSESNQIIFNNTSITILGYIKLGLFNNELHLKICKPIKNSDIIYLKNILDNWNPISLQFFRYIQMYNVIAKNFDDIPHQLVDAIISKANHCIRYGIPFDTYLIPYKKKISKLYDSDKEYLVNFYNKFEYILKINIVNKTNFEYLIFRVLSSDLSENKNELNNLRYLEQDLIKKGNLKTHQIEDFIQKLFYYGEIIS